MISKEIRYIFGKKRTDFYFTRLYVCWITVFTFPFPVTTLDFYFVLDEKTHSIGLFLLVAKRV